MGPFTCSSQSERKGECLESQGNKWKVGMTARQLQCFLHTVPSAKCDRVTGQLFSHSLGKKSPFNSSSRKPDEFLATSMKYVSSESEPAALPFRNSPFNCRRWLQFQGVKEPFLACFIGSAAWWLWGWMTFGEACEPVSSKESCISLLSSLRFAGSYCFVPPLGVIIMYGIVKLETNLCCF